MPDLTLKTAERLHVEHVLRLTKGKRPQAAQLLGVTTHRLGRIIERHRLYRDYAADGEREEREQA